MKLGVAAVLAMLLGAFAAHFLLADRGYVLVNFRGYVIEMSVPGLVIVLVLSYLVVRGARGRRACAATAGGPRASSGAPSVAAAISRPVSPSSSKAIGREASGC